MAGNDAAAQTFMRQRAWAAVLLAMMIYLALAVPFAAVQDVWIDESTQLLGSRLPLGRLFAWLAGGAEPLGVPPDRMPPLGYLVDWSWQRLAGSNPHGFRLLHLAFATCGVGLVAALAARRHGLVPALVTGLLLAASPGLVATGVEIRAYPLFFAATAVQLWLLAGLCEEVEIAPRSLLIFAAAGLAAIYLHFFGLVSTSALFLGLLAARARDRRTALWIAAVWVGVLLLALGILPFVGGARAISDDAAPAAADFSGVAYYLPRIYGHAAMLLRPVLAFVLFAGFGLLLLIAVGRAVSALGEGRWRRRAGFEAALIVALAAGVGVTIAAGFVVHGFDPLKPSYSLWMVPLAALLAGAACAGRGTIAWAGWGVALITVAALLSITATFTGRSAWFAHGPEAAIAEQIGAAPAKTALVYIGPAWGYGYFPLVHRYGGALPQFRLDGAGALHPIGRGGATLPAIPPALLDRFGRLLAVEITPRTGDDLHALAAGAATDGFDPPAPAVPGWRTVDTTIRPGLYWLQLSRLDKEPRR